MTQPVPLSDSYTVAVLQIAVEPVLDEATARQSMARNAERLAGWVRQLAPLHRVDLWVAPSLALTGHRRKDRGVSVEAVLWDLEEAFQPVAEALRAAGGLLATTAMERLPGLEEYVVHTGVVLGGEGIELGSPKVQDYGAPGMAAVREFLPTYIEAFGRDAVWPVIETPFGGVGIVVGSESLVPEAARMIAARGASVLVQPLSGASDNDRALPFETMLRAAAYANGLVVATAGAPGELRDGELRTEGYRPRSAVFGPDGEEVAAVSGGGEGFVAVRLSRAVIEGTRAAQARDTTPAWDLYREFYGGRSG